ncbi:MAG TPA: methyltransferase domain-containing protein [Pyrinomonadaceae bacterium]|jgi:SAM-dependent methyltransferase|nr:methyltransferase domain-containing protein [Pyrinomonadaceae bacterium]
MPALFVLEKRGHFVNHETRAMTSAYIHGTEVSEQERLALLNRLTNAPFIEFLKLGEADTVLEVGSGLGILAREVASRLKRGEIWGLEYSANQLARARDAVENLHFVQGDAHALPFTDESFSTVYCRYLLEHVADPVRVLREMRRVLRPGGRALAQENNILILAFYPECERFESVWQRFAQLQMQLGGDALIGKKLFALFKQAGFGGIELSLQPEIHHAGAESFRPWIENLIGNVDSGAAEMQKRGLASADELNAAVAELRFFAERDDASAIFYWNRAAGVKS